MGTFPQDSRNTAGLTMSLRALLPVAALALGLLPGIKAMPPDQMDAREIVRLSLQFDTLFDIFHFAPPRDYLCLKEIAVRSALPNGQPTRAIVDTYEAIRLYDATFGRLIRKDSQELSPDKARAEQVRFEKAVEKRAQETPGARAKRLKAERTLTTERDGCRDEFMKVFDFRMAGTEKIGVRPSWVVEVSPLPHATPRCGDLKTFGKFHFRLWIDQTEFHLARFEGDNIAQLTFGIVLMRLPAGGLHFRFEQTPNEDGIWLHSRDQFKMEVRTPMMSFPVETTITYSGYRRFRADSRIVPVDGN